MKAKDVDALIKKFGPGAPAPTVEDLLKDDSLMTLFGITKAGLKNATSKKGLADFEKMLGMDDFLGMAKGRHTKTTGPAGRSSGLAPAVCRMQAECQTPN